MAISDVKPLDGEKQMTPENNEKTCQITEAITELFNKNKIKMGTRRVFLDAGGPKDHVNNLTDDYVDYYVATEEGEACLRHIKMTTASLLGDEHSAADLAYRQAMTEAQEKNWQARKAASKPALAKMAEPV